jgi:hypothetical protein
MTSQQLRWLAVVATSLTFGHCSLLGQVAGSAPADRTVTLNAQGGDHREFFENPHMRAFYELSVRMLREPSVDVAAYEQKRSSMRSASRWVGIPQGSWTI